jgi:hypothetical protein
MTTKRAKKLEWDEAERKHLRRTNKDGFLLVDPGAVVGVHLNLNKRPFFNVKQPQRPGGVGDFQMETLGHVRALVLSKAWFYVGLSGSKKTAQGGGQKSPYAGGVGSLTAVELPDGLGFGTVPKSGSVAVRFNPRTFPAYESLFFCDPSGVPLSGAGKIVMRDWKLWASGPKKMSDKDVDKRLGQLGLTRADMGSQGRLASFMQDQNIPFVPTYWDDPEAIELRNNLIRVAYQRPELREHLLSIIKESHKVATQFLKADAS